MYKGPGLLKSKTVTALVLLQDMGGKSPFEALLIYVTPLAPDKTRLVKTPVPYCLPYRSALGIIVPTLNICMAGGSARRCLHKMRLRMTAPGLLWLACAQGPAGCMVSVMRCPSLHLFLRQCGWL